MNTSEVLDKAADAIQERGWMRAGGWVHPDPSLAGRSVCLEGAIQAATGASKYDCGVRWHRALRECDAYQAVAAYLGMDLSYQDLYDWNDVAYRTQEEVIEVLRAAAAVERTKEESLQEAEVSS